MKSILPTPFEKAFCDLCRQQSGFSILEAIMAIGILSIVSFAFLGWTNMYNKGITEINENNEIASSMVKLISAFGDDDKFCTRILGNTPLSATNPGSVDEISFWEIREGLAPQKKAAILTRGQPISPKTGVIARNISLAPSVQVSPDVIVADLEVTFEKPPADRPTQVVRSIPIYATVQGGRVLKCSISPANPLIVHQRTCQLKYDGYAFFAPTTNLEDESQKNDRTKDFCKDIPGIVWQRGTTPLTASCTGGYRVAASPLNPQANSFACTASTGEGTPIPPRDYFNIGTVSESYDPFTSALDVPTSTCTFAFVAGVDQSGYVSEIKCISNSAAAP